jgi:hypothetical protein
VLYLRRLKVPRLTQTFGIATATWRELCQGEVGEHVVTGLATPLLDVFDEPLVFGANEIAIFAVEPAGCGARPNRSRSDSGAPRRGDDAMANPAQFIRGLSRSAYS